MTTFLFLSFIQLVYSSALVSATPALINQNLPTDSETCPAMIETVSEFKSSTEISDQSRPPVDTKIQFVGDVHSGPVTEYEELVNNLNSFLGPTLAVSEIIINLKQSSYLNADYWVLNNMINQGFWLGGRPTKYRNAIFAHEFGHAVFTSHFRYFSEGKLVNEFEVEAENAANLKRVYSTPEYNLMKHRSEEIQGQIEALREMGESQKIDALATELEGLKLKMYALESLANQHFSGKKVQFRVGDHLILPYNELFADCVSVLFQRDGGIIADAQGIPHTDSNEYDASPSSKYRPRGAPRPRDFDIAHFKNWDNARDPSFVYSLFDPFRGVLWKLYMKNLPREEAPLFLKTYLLAVAMHLQFRATEGDLQSWGKKTSTEKLNQQFIRFFALAAKENGLPIRK